MMWQGDISPDARGQRVCGNRTSQETGWKRGSKAPGSRGVGVRKSKDFRS
jgi:hypothetical protein